MEFVASDHPQKVAKYLATEVLPILKLALEELLRKKAELKAARKSVDFAASTHASDDPSNFSPILWLAKYLRSHSSKGKHSQLSSQ